MNFDAFYIGDPLLGLMGIIIAIGLLFALALRVR